jgi:hypothetical protein
MAISYVEIISHHLYISWDFKLTCKMTDKGKIGHSPYVQGHYVFPVTGPTSLCHQNIILLNIPLRNPVPSLTSWVT